MKVKSLLVAGLASCVVAESASSLAAKGDGHLSAGEFQDAISAYGSAIQMEPGNYLYMFKRSAAYMSVGKNLPALDDLEKVLELKPGFEGALTQRARLNMKLGKFDLAIKDAKSLDSKGTSILEDAEHAMKGEVETEKLAKKKSWEECVNKATEVLRVAGQSLKTRKLRAKCRLATGDAVAALADLNNVASLTPSDPEPFVTMAHVYYYSLGDYDKALQQVQRCLRYDQDSKPCKAAHKQIRKTHKKLKTFDEATRKKKAPSNPYWAETITELVTGGELENVKIEAAHAFKHVGLENGSNLLVEELTDVLCDAYYYTSQYQDGESFCDDTLRRNPAYINAILLKAQKEVAAERYEAAMSILADAVNTHGVRDGKIDSLFNEAQTLHKRATTKDYYKILDCPRDADSKKIKKAFRDQTRKFHPDKYKGDMTLEEVERKMAEINEAYEILSDDDTRRRYDMGEDFTHGGQQGQGGPHGHGFPGGGPGGFRFTNSGGQQKAGGGQFHFNFPGGGGGDFGGFDFGQFMRQAQGGRS